MAKLTKNEFKKLVMENFEFIEGQDNSCEGAQLIDDKWYMPLWGCDTIQKILDDIDDTMCLSQKNKNEKETF